MLHHPAHDDHPFPQPQQYHPQEIHFHLPITLRHSLQLVLLLDRIAVRAALRRVDQLLRQTFRHRLDVPESCLTRANGQEGNGLVDTSQGRHIDGLSTDGTGRSDTGGVFARAAVDDGVNGDLDGVLVGHDVHLAKE